MQYFGGRNHRASRRVSAAEELTRRLSSPLFPYVKTGTGAQIERSPGLRLV
jgi:hypothetical protein